MVSATLRPSEYTAALIQALQARASHVRGAAALEIGSGSGVVLATLGNLGAASLCGIDIEEDAVSSGMLLLAALGHGGVTELYLGDMTWSGGGADGRALLDPFLEGLTGHLAADGRALITHNAFIGLDHTRDVLRRHGLEQRIVITTLVYIDEEKLRRMTPAVLEAEDGRTLHCYGPYAFGEMHVIEIARSGTLG